MNYLRQSSSDSDSDDNPPPARRQRQISPPRMGPHADDQSSPESVQGSPESVQDSNDNSDPLNVFGDSADTGSDSDHQHDDSTDSENDVDPHNQFLTDSDDDDPEEPPVDPAAEIIKLNESFHLSKRCLQAVMDSMRRCGVTGLPKDHRTLLKTPRRVETTEISGISYYYFGIQGGLRRAISNAVGDVPDEIIVHGNIDGLPLHKSCKRSAWPTLMSAENGQSRYAII